MERKTALSLVERKSFGGSYHDSFSHAAMFRTYAPHNFGMVTSQLFSSKLGSHLINKKFTYMTVAKNNVYYLPGGTDDYQWNLEGDSEVDFRVTELLESVDATPGKGGLRFKFALDREWLHEPVLLKTEGSNLPFIRIIGHPVQRSANSFEYEAEIQSGDPNAWIPVDYLLPGRKMIDISTMVSDELNQKYAGDQYGEMFKLQSWVGNFARKCEFSDKFIRTEIAAKKDGKMAKGSGYCIGGKTYNDAVGVGYVYQKDFKTKDNKTIEKGVFISMIEARLLERIERDREMSMEWGQLQKTVDNDTDRTIKVAPGWRQIVKDGHYKQHNGSLSLSDIYEYLNEIFITRKGFSDRHIKIASGEGGIEFLSRLLAQEANAFTTIDTNFIRARKDGGLGYNENELEFGAQFTKWLAPNGIIVEMVHDPIKDDRHLFPEKAPGTNRTLESFAMDIFDFGATDQKAEGARRQENITCVMQDGVESYFTVSNVYDFNTGAIKDGGNAYSNNKEGGIYREISGSLCVWDVSRVGRLEFVPAVNI